MSYPPRETEQPAPALNATRARQGRWGRHVLWVLVFGTLLAALGMFAAWTWKSTEDPIPVGRGMETVNGRGFDAPTPPPPNPENP